MRKEPDGLPPGSFRQAVWPSMLLIEALRRLATPLALAALNGPHAPADTGTSTARYEALAALVHAWPMMGQSRR